MRSSPSAVAAALVLALTLFALAADPPAPATARIEALISEIQGLKNASFVRNGSAYDAKTAAKFLRGKWESRRKEIVTPLDFIEKAASVSSTTGKPYLIRFNDGKEVKCGDYLKATLEKLQSGKP